MSARPALRGGTFLQRGGLLMFGASGHKAPYIVGFWQSVGNQISGEQVVSHKSNDANNRTAQSRTWGILPIAKDSTRRSANSCGLIAIARDEHQAQEHKDRGNQRSNVSQGSGVQHFTDGCTLVGMDQAEPEQLLLGAAAGVEFDRESD